MNYDFTAMENEIYNKIYSVYGLTKEKVESEENDEQLQCWLKINNINELSL